VRCLERKRKKPQKSGTFHEKSSGEAGIRSMSFIHSVLPVLAGLPGEGEVGCVLNDQHDRVRPHSLQRGLAVERKNLLGLDVQIIEESIGG